MCLAQSRLWFRVVDAMTGVETSFNKELAQLLAGTRSTWSVKSEQRGVLGRGQVDIVVTERGWPSIIMECKVGDKPDDIDKRFNEKFRDGTTPSLILEVKYDEKLRQTDNVAESTLQYCAWYDKTMRFPRTGYLSGSYMDLSVAIQYARKHTPPTTQLKYSIQAAADMINGCEVPVKRSISKIMSQEVSHQTCAMAALTISGALSFHDTAAEPNGIPLRNKILSNKPVNVTGLLDAWHDILERDYYPIFSPALAVLQELPDVVAVSVAYTLHCALPPANADIYGEVFQSVISDRKRLAAFYTKPEAAALLAAATIPHVWKSSDAVKKFRIADFACGTGTLLRSAYGVVCARYEATSGNSMCNLHPHMMAECLVGADVLPVATHLTAAALATVYPKTLFYKTCIYQPTQGGPDNRIGSLEWIVNNSRLFSSEYRLTGTGLSEEVTAPSHGTCSAVVMNPPYRRSQGPGGQSDKTDPRQMFTAFGASMEQQYAMNDRAAELFKDVKVSKRKARAAKTFCACAPAGLATYFMDLAHYKLRSGGHLGMVLPMTAATSPNFEKFRKLVATSYTDVVVFSIGGRALESFSVDTGMKEIILTARKLLADEAPSRRGLFISLDDAPHSTLEGWCVGSMAHGIEAIRLEDAPQGGTRVNIGYQEIGTALNCPLDGAWGAVGVDDFTAYQVTHHMMNCRLWLPGEGIDCISMITLNDMAEIGPSDLQIAGERVSGENEGDDRMTSYSGPFRLRDYTTRSTYHSLWRNNNQTQRCMLVEPDTTLERLPHASDADARATWDTRTRLHVNVTTDTTAQSLMVSYVVEKTVGGRSWPSISVEEKYEKALAVWCNSTLGILVRWAMSNRQQKGRATTSRTAIGGLPVPDLSKLSSRQIARFDDMFDEFAKKPLDRIKNLWKDPVRMEMDGKMLRILGLDGVDLDDIRRRLCREPSIHGGNTLELHTGSGETTMHRTSQVAPKGEPKTTIHATAYRILLRKTVDSVELHIIDYMYDRISSVQLDVGGARSTLTIHIPDMHEPPDGFDGGDGFIIIHNLPKSGGRRKTKIDELYEFVRGKCGLGAVPHSATPNGRDDASPKSGR